MEKSRKEFIGGSDIAAIIGISPWKDIHTLWLEKTGRKEQDPVNKFMQWGIDHEPIARKSYMEKQDIMVNPAFLEHEKYKFCCASLDGITFEGDLILEIKCPSSTKTLEYAKMQKIEDHYMAQVQWYLMVSKAEKAHFWVWYENEQILIEILPNKQYQQMLLDAAIKFWDLVTNDIEPEKKEDSYIEIDTPVFVELSEKWKKANEKLKQAQKEEKEIKEMLLNETDGGNCKGAGLKISLVEQTCTDWELVCAQYGITKEQLKPFQKMKAAYQKISLDKLNKLTA